MQNQNGTIMGWRQAAAGLAVCSFVGWDVVPSEVNSRERAFASCGG